MSLAVVQEDRLGGGGVEPPEVHVLVLGGTQEQEVLTLGTCRGERGSNF